MIEDFGPSRLITPMTPLFLRTYTKAWSCSLVCGLISSCDLSYIFLDGKGFQSRHKTGMGMSITEMSEHWPLRSLWEPTLT